MKLISLRKDKRLFLFSSHLSVNEGEKKYAKTASEHEISGQLNITKLPHNWTSEQQPGPKTTTTKGLNLLDVDQLISHIFESKTNST